MKDHERNRRDFLEGLRGLALSVWLVGFAASPAMPLSIKGTNPDIASASLGTTGPLIGLVTGPVSSFGSSLAGFLSVTTLWNNIWSATLARGVTADAFRTTADTVTSLTPNSSSNVIAQGQVGDCAKYLAPHWTAACSNAAPRIFWLSGEDRAFLFIEGDLVLDNGNSKSAGAPATTAFALTPKLRSDLSFAGGHLRQSGSESARLPIFGVVLARTGALVRRRMREAAKANV